MKKYLPYDQVKAPDLISTVFRDYTSPPSSLQNYYYQIDRYFLGGDQLN
jgi:hypothetical protein